MATPEPDVDLQQGRITVHRLKGSISAVYPLQPDVIKLLPSYLRSRTDSTRDSPIAAAALMSGRSRDRSKPEAMPAPRTTAHRMP